MKKNNKLYFHEEEFICIINILMSIDMCIYVSQQLHAHDINTDKQEAEQR